MSQKAQSKKMISSKRIPELLELSIQSKVVPMVTSSPGMGKSAMVKALAKKYNLKLIDVRLSQADPTDLLGFPQIMDIKDKSGNFLRKQGAYAPMETFPIAGDDLPLDESGNPMNGWLLFLDEFNSASKAVQAAAYKIVLDREVGKHSLHENVAMVCAGNLASDKAIVNEMSTALQSRLVHLPMDLDRKAWLEWANTDGDIDYRVTALIGYNNSLLHQFDPQHADHTFPCPRTWEFASNILKQIAKSDPRPAISMEHIDILSGTIGSGAAAELVAFSGIFKDLPTIDQILANPDVVKNITEPKIQFALSGLITNNTTKQNVTDMIKAVFNLPLEFQVICVRNTLHKTPELKKDPVFKQWVTKNAKVLV